MKHCCGASHINERTVALHFAGNGMRMDLEESYFSNCSTHDNDSTICLFIFFFLLTSHRSGEFLSQQSPNKECFAIPFYYQTISSLSANAIQFVLLLHTHGIYIFALHNFTFLISLGWCFHCYPFSSSTPEKNAPLTSRNKENMGAKGRGGKECEWILTSPSGKISGRRRGWAVRNFVTIEDRKVCVVTLCLHFESRILG